MLFRVFNVHKSNRFIERSFNDCYNLRPDHLQLGLLKVLPGTEMMENAGWLEHRYYDFMTTAPIDVTEELKRLPTADFHLCCALMTMLLREDHFSNGSFVDRIADGSVDRIILRMKTLRTCQSIVAVVNVFLSLN